MTMPGDLAMLETPGQTLVLPAVACAWLSGRAQAGFCSVDITTSAPRLPLQAPRAPLSPRLPRVICSEAQCVF